MSPSRRAAVLGHPISHSLSPLLHRAAYEALGLDWEYEAHDVEAAGLEAFVAGLGDQWAGLSLTMPLKDEAARLADFAEPTVKVTGVANTLLFQGAGPARQTVAANTDVAGVVSALREAGVGPVERAVVLGGGATAVSAMAALAELGCTEPWVAVRSRARAGGLMRASARMGTSPRFIDFERAPEALAQAQVAVSTVPADAGAMAGEGLLEVAAGATLLDAIYSPLVTPLMSVWEARGGTAVSGTRMLLHQAAEQVRLMTGLVAPVDAMDEALLSHFSHTPPSTTLP